MARGQELYMGVHESAVLVCTKEAVCIREGVWGGSSAGPE